MANFVLVGTVVTVVLKQVRECLRIGQIVDSYDLYVTALKRNFESVAADSTKTIDSNSCFHMYPTPK